MTNIQRWLALAATFHAIADTIEAEEIKGPHELDLWAKDRTYERDGVREAVQFMLHLWDSAPGRWHTGDFHLRRSLESWDTEHRLAFQAWAENPVAF